MWTSISPRAPSELVQIGTGLTQGLSTIRTALELVRTQAQAAALEGIATETAAIDAANSAISALVSAINTALNVLVDDAGLYVLLVPIPKKGLARLAAGAVDNGLNASAMSSSREATAYLNYPINNVIARATESDRVTLQNSRIIDQVFNPVDLFAGGCTHFVKTLSEALFDAKDVNRPRFDADSKWAYTILLAGGSDVTSVLPAASFFDRLLGGGRNANNLGSSRGLGTMVPQGVQVQPSGRENYAVVQWELVPASQTLRSFDHSRLLTTKYAVIRTNDLRARTATCVTDLFATRELRAGLEGNYGAKVLAVNAYDGVTTRYVDTSTLDANTTYYYHVAFATRIEPALLPVLSDEPETEAQPVDLGFDLLSSAQEFKKPVTRDAYQQSGGGTIPDWSRSPSLAGMVPSLNRFVDQIQEFLRTLQSGAQNVRARNDTYVQFLTQEINRYASRVAEIERQIQEISTVFDAPSAGIYATIRSGSGGSSAFLADVTRAFEDPNDPNLPPFLNGDEFVTGVVILTVAPDLARVQAAFAALQALFTAGNSTDAALAGIESINGQLAAVEAALVSELSGGTNEVANPSNTFNEDMTPRPPGTGDASCD